MIDSVIIIPKEQAVELIKECHYSKVMPRITKLCIGGFENNKLVAVCTLGYGVRPLHTLKKAFPNLEVKDYLELGKLCVSDEMPKNTESNFIARCIKILKKEYPELKLLFSWADAIIGKPGYVYQSSNFFYGGFIWTEMYLTSQGNRIHPRTLQGISTGNKEEGKKFKSRSFDVSTKMGLQKYFGLQFRYVYPLCDKKEWDKIREKSPFNWERKNYPKDNDCKWKRQIARGKREECGKPPFIVTEYIKTEKVVNKFNYKKQQLSLGLQYG